MVVATVAIAAGVALAVTVAVAMAAATVAQRSHCAQALVASNKWLELQRPTSLMGSSHRRLGRLFF